MGFKIKTIFSITLLFVVVGFFSFTGVEDKILSYTLNLNEQKLKMYWQNDAGENYSNFRRLKTELSVKGEELVFATNGGMYKKEGSPQGLYIERGITLSKINKQDEGYGNFYLQPNGIFYITNDNNAGICKTTNFNSKGVKYATQSGPMLLIDGKIHDKFTNGSKNLNIRNGVGILPNNNIVFAMSKEKINFYDFANYFRSLGCKNALYLDGFVSKTYLPEKKWMDKGGSFGVIIGETKKK